MHGCHKPRKFLSISTRKGRRVLCNNCGKLWKDVEPDSPEKKCCAGCRKVWFDPLRRGEVSEKYCSNFDCPCHKPEDKKCNLCYSCHNGLPCHNQPEIPQEKESSFVDRKLTEYWAKVKVGMFTNSVNQTPNHQMFESFLRSALEEAIRNKK